MSTYTVRFDEEEPFKLTTTSLAEVANNVRGEAKRIRVWAESGLQLIDTKFGDVYGIAAKEESRNQS